MNNKKTIIIGGIVAGLVAVLTATGITAFFILTKKDNNKDDRDKISQTSTPTATPTKTPTVTPTTSLTSKLASFDGNSYTLYYPKTYSKYSNPQQDSSFISPIKNSLGGGNNIGTKVTSFSDDGKGMTQADCKSLGDQITSAINGTLVSNTVSNQNGLYSCYVKVNLSISNIAFVSETKSVYKLKSSGQSNGLYTVNITYAKSDEGTSEINDLKASFNAFKIK